MSQAKKLALENKKLETEMGDLVTILAFIIDKYFGHYLELSVEEINKMKPKKFNVTTDEKNINIKLT